MTPLHLIVTRMKRLPLRHQAAHLKALIDAEKPRSIRRSELEAMLRTSTFAG
ncbi:hypothetical protein IVB34_47600 [Bradyrhizobium sp. 2]|uniref:hypothetical protein n=1 Tax=Bradyrhizobium sp. 2 TaxID=190045 RepID=UPI001FFA3AD6|nr:hypothetical protein [Bradyrhizobium sp. 2]MCK1465756.1 hypothetical protein [Bradyrhizobium sp. 2]